ncbi:hypothetical protein ACFRAR_05705 [Kitasatospora sp. NPDC056651]|uniref:hypothetical protein n=1 Tax=Kitasatospora sp. NPDC056651 TaxID=3345892 RepID=UPI003673BB44
MPVRLLAALLLGLFSLLPVGCAQQHLDAHPLRPAGVAAPAEPHGSSPAPAERHCGAGEAAAPARRSVRSACAPAPAPAVAPAGDRTDPGVLPATRPAVAVERASKPRVPLLVTGRWRI